MPDLLKACSKSAIEDLLKVYLELQMSEECAFVLGGFPSVRKEKDVRFDFWRSLIFRPDVAGRVAELCGDPEAVGRPQAAAMLREAMEWSVDFW